MMNIKLLHGDFKKIIKDDIMAALITTSPPYNISSQSPARITNRKNGGFDAKSYRSIREYADNLPEDVYQKNQIDFLTWAYNHLLPNGVITYNHKPRRKNHALIHPLTWISQVPELTLVEEIIWDRRSTHNCCNKMMWQTTERIYVIRRTIDKKYRFVNHGGLRYRSDLWSIPRAKANGHNAPFPIELAMAIVEAWSKPGDLVMDPYMGSGTTAIACKLLKRDFVGSEILKKYYTMACKNVKGVME